MLQDTRLAPKRFLAAVIRSDGHFALAFCWDIENNRNGRLLSPSTERDGVYHAIPEEGIIVRR
jgi:hypothetical protein